MLLSRAPREVYKVYDEDEFLSGRDWAECQRPEHDRTADRRGAEQGPRRLAAAAMLCGALGAVGGLVVIGGPSPARVSRRTLNRATRATAGLLAPASVSRPRLWRARAFAAGPDRQRRLRPTHADAQDQPRRRDKSERRRPSRGEGDREMQDSPRQVDVAITTGVPVGAMRLAAPRALPAGGASTDTKLTASSSEPSSAPAEFGFER